MYQTPGFKYIYNYRLFKPTMKMYFSTKRFVLLKQKSGIGYNKLRVSFFHMSTQVKADVNF